MDTQVNLGSTIDNGHSSVAFHSLTNSIIVTWHGEEFAANSDIFAASFNTSGAQVTAQTNLTSGASPAFIAANDQSNASVASNNNGDNRLAISFSSMIDVSNGSSSIVLSSFNYSTSGGFTAGGVTEELTATPGVPFSALFSDAFFVENGPAATTYASDQNILNFSTHENKYDSITNPDGWYAWEQTALRPSQSNARIYVGDTVSTDNGIITVSAEGGQFTRQINITYSNYSGSISSNIKVTPAEVSGNAPFWRNFSLPAMDAQANGHAIIAWANTLTGNIQVSTYDVGSNGNITPASSLINIEQSGDIYKTNPGANIGNVTGGTWTAQDQTDFQEGGVSVAIDPVTGNSLVVWTSDHANGNRDITGRFVSVDGINLGSTIHFNPTAIDGDQWAPAVTAIGNDKFAVTWTSDDGVPGTSDIYLEVVSVSGLPVNHAPVANDDNYTGTVSTKQYFPISEMLLGNDSDSDGDAINFVKIQNAVNGTAILSPSEEYVIFTPNAGYYGTTSFEYVISDPRGATDTGRVTLNIPAPPPPPPPAPAVYDYNPFTPGDDTFTMPGYTENYPYFNLDGLMA